MKKKRQIKKKKNVKGFTLIELLAVITIMGILMLIAIPAVSRTIENTRRQTFANTALQYIKSFKNEVYQDQVKCNGQKPSALGPGYYYYLFDSSNSTGRDLMEQGGTSSWGGSPIRGVITMYKPYTQKDTDGQKSDIEYSIFMTDSVGRGIGVASQSCSGSYYKPTTYVTEKNITRSEVLTKNSNNRKEWYDNNFHTYSNPSYYSYTCENTFRGTKYNGVYENGTYYYSSRNDCSVQWYQCTLTG